MNLHNWYNFHMGFRSAFVRATANKISVDSNSKVLDPFCGSGTTLTELIFEENVNCIGIEAHPFLAWVAFNKSILPIEVHRILIGDPKFLARTLILGEQVLEFFDRYYLDYPTSDKPIHPMLIKGSISSTNWHLLITLNRFISACTEEKPSVKSNILRMALIQVAVDLCNLRFAPEATVCPNRTKLNALKPVSKLYRDALYQIIKDLREIELPTEFLYKETISPSVLIGPYLPVDYMNKRPGYSYFHGINARNISAIQPDSLGITHVITSPPYPNEKDYTRSTRLEAVLLGFITNQADLTQIKHNLIPSNSRFPNGCYTDTSLPSDSVKRLAAQVREATIESGKTDGFSAKYPTVLRSYFGSMTRHLMNMRQALVPGAKLAYLIGDQASYHGIPVRTAELLGEIAETYDYKVNSIEVYKDRTSKTKNGKQNIPENILYMTYRG